MKRTPIALCLSLLAATGAQAATYSVTESLVSGTAVFDPFDDLGGTRTLNYATIYLDVEADVLTDPISNRDASPTTIDLEQDLFLSWAPDDATYHSEPTDVGEATVTINTPITIPGGSSAVGSLTHVIPTQSYVENTYDFNEQYGVLLLSAITAQSVSVSSGAGNINGFGTSVSLSGSVTVEYDYGVAVPEPASGLLLLLGGVTTSLRRRC